MKSFFFLLLAPFVSAELVDVTLNLTPSTSSENTLFLGLTAAGFPSSDESQASGTVNVRIDIDPEDGSVSSIELLSGDVSATPVNFTAVFFVQIYNISSTTLGGTVDTPLPPAPVTNGQSAANLHELIINSGTLSGTTATGAIPPQNFADNPVSGTGDDGDFLEINATLNANSTATNRIFDLDFTFPVDIEQAIEEEGISGSITATGTIRATGQTSITVEPPNPYLVWAAANGIENAPFEGNDFSSLLPNGLFWALGYEAGEQPEGLVPTGNGTFGLNPPSSGTATEVAVQLSFDLSNPNGWTTITSIPAGSTAPQGPFGGGSGPAFLRLLVADPAE